MELRRSYPFAHKYYLFEVDARRYLIFEKVDGLVELAQAPLAEGPVGRPLRFVEGPRAAAMARSMSAAVASAVWPRTSSVAGLMLSKAPPPGRFDERPVDEHAELPPTVESALGRRSFLLLFRSLALRRSALRRLLTSSRSVWHPQSWAPAARGRVWARSGPYRLHGGRGYTWGDAYWLRPSQCHPWYRGPEG